MASGAPADVDRVELIGGVEHRELVLAPHDPGWADRFENERRRIVAALGARALQLEHIGSTAVPGLPAKPIIDVLVTVERIADEVAYLPALVAAGYALRVREPGHRLFRTPARDVHVHVLQHGDPAAAAYLDLRDRLRVSEVARERYTATKRALIATGITDMNVYSDGKGDVIAAIRAGEY